jgi:hypothetical protein
MWGALWGLIFTWVVAEIYGLDLPGYIIKEIGNYF